MRDYWGLWLTPVTQGFQLITRCVRLNSICADFWPISCQQVSWLHMMTLYEVSRSCRKLLEACVFFTLCGRVASDQPHTYIHAGLNCASCSNSITLASAQVPHWSHTPLDGVIRPAVHFIVYTPWNGDICEKANKNIPPTRNAPGISSPCTWLQFLQCSLLFSQSYG